MTIRIDSDSPEGLPCTNIPSSLFRASNHSVGSTALCTDRRVWYFGIKAHIGVDSRIEPIHSVAATAANLQDRQVLSHGQETCLWVDAAYSRQHDVVRQHSPSAQNFIQTQAHRQRPLSEAARPRNWMKSRVRAKVEHVFSWRSSESLDGPTSATWVCTAQAGSPTVDESRQDALGPPPSVPSYPH
jgi:hypothetical protein